jgi:hypothetical protein
VLVVLVLGFFGYRWYQSTDGSAPNPVIQAQVQEAEAKIKANPEKREEIIAELLAKAMQQATQHREKPPAAPPVTP